MAFKGGFGVRCARAVRKKRCGSACVDHIVAIVHASIAAMCVDVHLGVLSELVVLEIVRTGGTSDSAGQGDVCGDECGSVGTILRPTQGATKKFRKLTISPCNESILTSLHFHTAQ